MRECGRRARGMTLIEILVYLAVFSMIATVATVLSVRALRLVSLGLEASHQRYLLDRALQQIARDIRNARQAPPSRGPWTADAHTLILDMPPAEGAPEGEAVVVYRFAGGTLTRGSAARHGVPMRWAECVPEFAFESVTFERPAEAPSAVRVRLERAPGNEVLARLGHVWEFVAAIREGAN